MFIRNADNKYTSPVIHTVSSPTVRVATSAFTGATISKVNSVIYYLAAGMEVRNKVLQHTCYSLLTINPMVAAGTGSPYMHDRDKRLR